MAYLDLCDERLFEVSPTESESSGKGSRMSRETPTNETPTVQKKESPQDSRSSVAPIRMRSKILSSEVNMAIS